MWQALVEHYSGAGQPEVVERAVLHMDVASLDLNQVHSNPAHGMTSSLLCDFSPYDTSTLRMSSVSCRPVALLLRH